MTISCKTILAAAVLSVGISLPLPVLADETRLGDLFAQLQDAETLQDAARIEAEIELEWGRSGSAAIDLLVRRGTDALEAGDAVVAAEHFTAAIDHDPTLAAAWAGRAAAYYASGQFGPALDDLRQTLVLEPRQFDALRGFGALLEEMSRPEAALEVYRRVLDLYPLDPVAGPAAARLEQDLDGQTL